MKRVLNALISLYPKTWRNRYQNEFRAVLDDVSPTWRTLFDVFGGAMKMQMKIWSPWKTVAAFAILGVTAAVVFSLTVPDQYVSTAVIHIENGGLGGVADIVKRIESRSALTRLINEQGLYQKERMHLPIEDVIEQMKQKDIRISTAQSAKGVPAISISVAAGDAGKAQRAAMRLVDEFMKASLFEHAGVQRESGQTFSLTEPASLPAHPVNPRRSRILIMGLIAGLLAGAVFVLFSGLRIWKNAAVLGIAGTVLTYLPEDQAKVKRAMDAVLSSVSLHEIATRLRLSPNQELKDHLHVQLVQGGRAVSIQFDSTDRWTAHFVTQAVVARFVQEDWNFQIIDPASFPQAPFFPNRSAAAGTGLVLGLGIATILGAWERRVGIVRKAV
jgi:capsular polysaccharide biosynthesis protein